MVSKPVGSRPPAPAVPKQRGVQGPIRMDQRADAHAGPSRSRPPAERVHGATGNSHIHTLPLGTSVPSGGQQMASRAGRTPKESQPTGAKRPQTLPGHVNRSRSGPTRPAAPSGASGSGPAQRNTGSTSSSTNTQHEALAQISHHRASRDPAERYARRGTPHTLPGIQHQGTNCDLSPSKQVPKERCAQQGQHRQQASTLPPGGACGNGGGGRRNHPTPRQAPPRQAPPRQAPPRPTPISPSSAHITATSQAPRTTVNRDHQVAERQQLPQGGVNDRDIARITIDARTIVTRPLQGGSSHANVSGATVGTISRARRNPAPAPPRIPQQVITRQPLSAMPVDPNNLQLYVADVNNADQIRTNNLSAGISYGRPERPETTEALPDILNSHILPPYTVRQNQHRVSRSDHQRVAASGARYAGHGSRSRRRSRSRSGLTQLDEDGKACCSHDGCLRCVTVVTTFRWVLVALALLGVVCVITGIVLGALHMTVGSSFLTLSLMFIGLGVMLVVVVGVGWKCTPPGHEPCHLLFNLGDHCTRDVRASSSHRRHRDRNHWYGGVTYPEFRYRRPPPSYNASMQEFQQQLMLAQIQLNQQPMPPSGDNDDNYSLPSSPPPSYKSRASTIRPGLHITFPPQDASYPSSQPPTYRSRRATDRPPLNMEEGGIDNLACSDIETPWSASSAVSSSMTSPLSSCRTSPERSLPNSASSTLHRAADRVVDYLDDVLQHHTPVGERPSRPVAGGADLVERPSRPVTGGATSDMDVKTAVDKVDTDQSTQNQTGAGGYRSTASLPSMPSGHTSSTIETNRIQDTQL